MVRVTVTPLVLGNRYLALLRAIPTPHTLKTVGLDWELSYLVSDCNESQRMPFQVLKLEFYKMQML